MFVNSATETIRFETNVNANFTIDYGTTTSYGHIVSRGTLDIMHEINITGLLPNTLYYYNVTIKSPDGQTSSYDSTFTTAVDGGTSASNFVFAVLGDSRADSGDGVDTNEFPTLINHAVNNYNPRFIIMTGDVVTTSGNDYNTIKQAWKTYTDQVVSISDHIPIFNVLGNHEHVTASTPNALLRYQEIWMHPHNGDGESGYYDEVTFWQEFGNSLFIFISTEEPSFSPRIQSNQLTWLNNTLRKRGYTHKFVFFHRPICGTTRSGTVSGSYPADSAMLDQMFSDNNVTIAFAGHNHYYCYNTTASGMTYVITGGAGAPLYPTTNGLGTVKYSEYHYVVVNVTDVTVNATMVNMTGSVRHSFQEYGVTQKQTIFVPDDYPTIQEAINAASDGDTVFVRNGTYYENIVVNKTVSLVGEDRSTTIIDGNVAGTGVHVTTDHVTVQGFGVQNCEIGIKVESNDNALYSNLVSSNGYYETQLLNDQEIYPDYVSPLHRWYLHNMINGSYTAFFNITDHTPAISVQALGQEDVNQLGIGLFHDKNNDKEPQLQEYVGYMEGKDQNVHVFLVNPPVGRYIIKVLGWEVLGDPGHFNLNITTYTGYGIMFLSSNNNTITENLVTHNPVGLYLYDAHNSTIRLNDAVENVGGIVLSDSRDCVISNNNASSNEFGSGLYQFGIGMAFWSVHGFNISENNMSSSTFGMWLTNSSDNEVIGNDLVSNLAWSLLIYYSHDNTVQYNNISLTGDGVRMMFSRQNNFTENHFESNGHAGIFFWQNNTNNSITKNRFYSNGQHGVELKLWCNSNTIADNDIRHNERNGILILESTSNMVTRNYVYSNARGVISYDSSDNKIYHNNIIDSWEEQAADFNSANIWNNGCEGNYWSNYNGTDLDGDGIGDTYLPWEGVDYYPLMNPYWNPSDVNHDLKVDIFDVVLACSAYNSTPLGPNWNPHCDVAEPYGKIDIYDIVLMCNSYGEEYNP